MCHPRIDNMEVLFCVNENRHLEKKPPYSPVCAKVEYVSLFMGIN